MFWEEREDEKDKMMRGRTGKWEENGGEEVVGLLKSISSHTEMGNGIKAAVSSRGKQDKLKLSESCTMDYA